MEAEKVEEEAVVEKEVVVVEVVGSSRRIIVLVAAAAAAVAAESLGELIAAFGYPLLAVIKDWLTVIFGRSGCEEYIAEQRVEARRAS